MAKFDDRNSWGMKTAARLRSVHASFAEESADRRRGFMEDEIEFALEEGMEVPGENRASLLECLQEWFPVYGEVSAKEPVVSTPQSAVACSSLSLEDLLRQVEERRAELTEGQMERLKSIVGSSFPASSGPALPPELAENFVFPQSSAEIEDCLKAIRQLWRVVGATGETKVRVSRLVKMLGILSGSFQDLHALGWSFWKEIAPREAASALRSTVSDGSGGMIRTYMEGGEVSATDFFREVDLTKRMVVALLYSVHRAGLEYGRFCERKFAPDSVQDSVAMEESATDVRRIRDLERKCWNKYQALSRNRTAEAIHEEFLGILAEATLTHIRKQA